MATPTKKTKRNKSKKRRVLHAQITDVTRLEDRNAPMTMRVAMESGDEQMFQQR